MPFYEFECNKCNNKYEELCYYDSTEKYKDVTCPSCGSKKKTKLVSAAIVTFANPKDTSKFESFNYRAGYNMEKAKEERRKAEKASADGIPPYSSIDDISKGNNFGKVK
jgi:putative FmdB family regulatory protein